MKLKKLRGLVTQTYGLLKTLADCQQENSIKNELEGATSHFFLNFVSSAPPIVKRKHLQFFKSNFSVSILLNKEINSLPRMLNWNFFAVKANANCFSVKILKSQKHQHDYKHTIFGEKIMCTLTGARTCNPLIISWASCQLSYNFST